MELNFRKFIEQNTVGTHNDTSVGAFQSSSQTGSEDSNDDRGLMPSTDMTIIPRDRRMGTIKAIKERGGRTGDIDIHYMSQDGHSKWIKMSRGEFDRYQGGGTGNSPLAVGKRITIDYQANNLDPSYDKKNAQIDRITVH